MTRFAPDPPMVIGLVGGVASGKSAVARLFAESELVVIDADAEARSAVDRPEVRAAIRVRFGDAVFAADGALDRAALADLVFSAPEARADLEAITHPTIRAAILKRLSNARALGKSALLDVPLLLERGLVEHCDAVVFVDVSEEERLRRSARRGWDAAELRRREGSQLPVAVKKTRATATIDNSGTLDRTREQVVRLLEQWTRCRPSAPRTEGPRT